jgi:hypothetical protein
MLYHCELRVDSPGSNSFARGVRNCGGCHIFRMTACETHVRFKLSTRCGGLLEALEKAMTPTVFPQASGNQNSEAGLRQCDEL